MRAEKWLRKTSDTSFVLLLLFIALLRVGPSPIGAPWVNSVYEAAKSFPNPINYISYSPLPTLIAKVLRQPPALAWWVIFGFILVLWFIVVMRKIKRIFPDHYRLIQIIFAASQVVLLEITHIGHYDNISVVGATVILGSADIHPYRCCFSCRSKPLHVICNGNLCFGFIPRNQKHASPEDWACVDFS